MCRKSYSGHEFYVHRVYLWKPPTTYSVTISSLQISRNQSVVLAGRSCENPLISLPSFSPGDHARYLDLNFMKPHLMSTDNEMVGAACFKNAIVTWVLKSLIVTHPSAEQSSPPRPRPRPPVDAPFVSRPDTGGYNIGSIYDRPARSLRSPRPLNIVIDGLDSVPYKVEPTPMRYVISSEGPTHSCVTDNDDLGGLGACRGETPDGCFCTRDSVDDTYEYRCLPNFTPRNTDVGPSGGCEPLSIDVHTFDDADNDTNSTTIDPWKSCEHVKPSDDSTEPPIPLDNSGACAERSVYTPPELTCATPETNFRVIYSHLNREDDDVFIPAGTNAVVTVSSERKADLLYGSAQATVYHKNLDVIEREVYKCQKYALVLNKTTVKLWGVIPVRANVSVTIEPLPVDDDECKQWWSTKSACASLRKAAADYNAEMPEKCEMTLPTQWSDYLTTYNKPLTVSGSFFGVKRVVHASVERIRAKVDVARLSDGLVANPLIPTERIDTLVRDTNVLPVGRYVTTDKNYTYVYNPIPRQAMCSHREMFRGPLSIAAFDERGMAVPYFEAGDTRQRKYYILKNGVHQFSRTIQASWIKDAPAARVPQCYNPPVGSQMIEVGNILIHLIVDQPSPTTTERETDDTHCVVSSDPFPYHDLSAVSAAPYSTRPTDIPKAMRWRYSSMNNRDNSSVVVECYSNAVVVWSRPDVIISHVKYVAADTGRIVFDNSYLDVDGAESRSPPRPSMNSESQPCILSGPADKCHWVSHCDDKKYCSDQADVLQCLCKSNYDDISGQCVINNVCLPGFVSRSGGCTDIDECTQPGGNPCANKNDGRTACVNIIGSFECVEPLRCPATSRLNEESGECEDVNECASDDANDCDPDLSTCRNLSPGYECICNNQWTHYQSADRKTCLQYSFEIRLLHPRFIRCCSHHHEMSAMLVRCRIDPSSEGDLIVYNHIEPYVCAEFSFADSHSPRSVVGSPFSTTRSNISGELESILQLSGIIQTELNVQEKERLGVDQEFVLNTMVDRHLYHGQTNPAMKRSITRAITYNVRSVGRQYFLPYSGSDRQTTGCQDIRTIGTLNEHIAQPRPSRLSHSLPAVMEDKRNGGDNMRDRLFAYSMIVSLFTLQAVML